MPIGGKDAFLSKVTFRRESKWYSKTKQELKDMATIEERAKLASEGYEDDGYSSGMYMGYVVGAKEQKAIDEAKLLKLKSAWEKQAQINHDDEANYQQGYHDAIEKARKWLKEHIYEYIAVGNTDFGKPYDIHLCSEELFDDFPKAMEE